jgi:hypothetical protein
MGGRMPGSTRNGLEGIVDSVRHFSGLSKGLQFPYFVFIGKKE